MANIHDPVSNETSLERVTKADDQSITSIQLYLNEGNNEGETLDKQSWVCALHIIFDSQLSGYCLSMMIAFSPL